MPVPSATMVTEMVCLLFKKRNSVIPKHAGRGGTPTCQDHDWWHPHGAVAPPHMPDCRMWTAAHSGKPSGGTHKNQGLWRKQKNLCYAHVNLVNWLQEVTGRIANHCQRGQCGWSEDNPTSLLHCMALVPDWQCSSFPVVVCSTGDRASLWAWAEIGQSLWNNHWRLPKWWL